MNILQTPKATLVLKTCTLPNPGANNTPNSNSNGSVNRARTQFTFNNINIRLLLGDLYDKHDSFNLKLNSVTMSNLGMSPVIEPDVNGPAYPFGTDYEDRTVSLEMSGLPFLNNTYNTLIGVNSDTAVLGTYVFDYNSCVTQYDDTSIVTFHKGGDMNNISIAYKTVERNNEPSIGAVGSWFPNMMFHFSIYGIPRTDR